jgi:hypothetical protein
MTAALPTDKHFEAYTEFLNCISIKTKIREIILVSRWLLFLNTIFEMERVCPYH